MTNLKKSLSPLLLWSLGVGNVISGMYFGWNLGLEKAGALGMAIATIVVILMYVFFTQCYAELACAIPKAGGGFDYANRAFGKNIGYWAGISQLLLFWFGPPAIALGIGDNMHLLFPNIPVTVLSVFVYFLFTFFNILGVKFAATFELIITVLAIFGLLFFAYLSFGHISTTNIVSRKIEGGLSGILAAIPFAIWFFLGIEGLANIAEESENPQKDLSKGFNRAIITLVLLCVLTFICTVGPRGWQAAVYNENGNTSDSPLSLVLGKIYGLGHIYYQIIILISVLGLAASFHGLMLAGGRSTLEFARLGYLPTSIAHIHSKFGTPGNALVLNALIGVITILSGKTGQIITLSVIGALSLYLISLASMIKLRQSEPDMQRPFRVKLYPLVPVLAFVICLICIVSIVLFYPKISVIYVIIIALGLLIRKLI